jgi:hypothetical protein
MIKKAFAGGWIPNLNPGFEQDRCGGNRLLNPAPPALLENLPADREGLPPAMPVSAARALNLLAKLAPAFEP